MESDKYLRYLDDVVESIKDCPKGRNKCTVLIGAGCSVSAGIPLSSGIIEKIREDFPKAYERADPKTYSKCMEMLAPEQRRKLINDYIKNAKINWAHLCLAKLMDKGYVDRILTTNFDPLALRACALLGRVPAVYDITSFTAAFKPNIIPDKSIFYLHGQCTGFNLVNTEEELRKNISNLLPFFKDSLQGRTWVVVGYSGADPVFDELIKVDCFDNNLFWVCHSDEPAGHIREKLLLDGNYAFYLKQFDADDFFIQLTQKLGCFPEIATKPFSHIKALLEMVTDYPLAGGKDKSDLTKEGIQLIEEAIKQYEIQPSKIDKAKKGSKIPELMYAKGLLSEAKYDELINLIDENIINISDEWKDLKATTYFQKGVSQFRESRQELGNSKEVLINKAINLYDQAINLKPDEPDYLNNKAAALNHKAEQKKGKEKESLQDEAIKLYNQAIELRPDDPDYLNNKANALGDKAKLKSGLDKDVLLNEAIKLYDQAIKLKPDDPDFLNNEANTLKIKAKLKSGEEKERLLDEAIKLFDQAIKLKSDNPIYLNNKANALGDKAKLKSGREKEGLLDETIKSYDQAIKMKPDNPDYLNNKANALGDKAELKSREEKERLLDAAIKLYDKAIKLKPDNPDYLNNKAIALKIKAKLKSGEEKERLLDAAIKLYDKAIKLKPDDPIYLNNKALALRNKP